MTAKPLKTLEVRSRAHWHAWLQRHHASVAEIWLVFHKQRTRAKGVDREASIEEALCFGWIDSLVRRLDDERYAVKFTPRKPDSRWSDVNRRRYASLEKRGLLEPPGRENSPTGKRAYALRQRRALDAPVPRYIERALKAEPAAWRFFETLAPSYRRAYVGWIDAAKRQETKERRLGEAVAKLAKGEKLGLK
ncbi:MAG TPA: YdeI/OmpD-associated family protein [Gammaproteobacteria bacterium]|nr:YdeI/OmpD-associated family protein [Gammaproteobacteria bacterium]